MPTWRSPKASKAPPPAEYVVRHERPYFEQMERAFRVGASVVGALAFVGMLALLIAAVSTTNAGKLVAFGILVIVLPVLAYAAVWASGAVLIGVVVAFRSKRRAMDAQAATSGQPEGSD